MDLNEEEDEPRLFQCSNASGVFTVNEIYDFTQVRDSVFILANDYLKFILEHIT